ncbi:B12-binding domain-containing radical SAM protein [Catellatospora sichuanensis]|uniref:B12-binding domain-containing radical SAM protein n=1 Tax=Catellatospora sichuanensis TaxID=1969805 RepID=UPI001642ED8B|nr:radical SAM protein [Catellatospora sichuanensis]
MLLVQPPYLRLYGSHNNRVPLELHYLHRFLAEVGITSHVLNLDKTDASVSIPWSGLYQNSNLIESFFNGNSPLLDESIERILSRNANVVVLAGGDSLTPWADLGNPFVASLLSRSLRHHGVYCIGVGPFFNKVRGRFVDDFDALLLASASPTICDIVQHRIGGEIVGESIPTDARPLIDDLDNADVANVVMTHVGCPLGCNFCLGASTGSRQLNIDSVIRDLTSRKSRYIEIGDAIFPMSEARFRDIEAAFRGTERQFACELSVAKCKRPILERLSAIGVTQIKLGIESGSDLQLSEMGKRQTVAGIELAVQTAKELSLKVTGYVLIGGNGLARRQALDTLDLCRRLNLDDLVVNVLAHFDLANRDFSRDSHWSRALAEFWDVSDVMPQFFGMQASEKAGVGRLLHVGGAG